MRVVERAFGIPHLCHLQVYLVVMGNLFNMPVQLNVKYDLKGSSLGRTAGVTPEQDPHAILKDLDLKTTFK